MSVHMTGEVLYACSAATADPVQRAALGSLVNAVRRDAPSVQVRDTPVDSLPHDEDLPVRVAVPLTLGEDGDVSEALVLASRGDSGLLVAGPLGPDWSLAEICVQRLIEAGARKEDAIVLGVTGGRHDAASHGHARAARLVSAVWGGPVSIGAVGGPGVPLRDAINLARADHQRVVVASYVLTPGRTADRMRQCGADVVTAPLLDGAPEPRITSLVLTRFHQALGVSAPSL
ncbi:sirohydrochlorin chelatase [Aeromicrobium sp. CTD01-1L150]|uniref:sirohydrochlorin chelatase n=1 Tax=Aeromicrobium sp. CTD01-1L150 TaxID=3341830 RepID=UPI0035BEF31F